MNTVELVDKYDNLMDTIGDDIKKSRYKTRFFLEVLGLKRGLFYKKIKEKRFTSKEIKTLSKYLYPEEYKDYEVELISKLLKKSQAQIRSDQSEGFEAILKESKKNYGL